MKIVRLFAAPLLSPLCVPILFFLSGILLSGYTEECCGHLEKFLLGTASVGLMSYTFSFLLGIPIVLLVRWRRRETMRAYVATSAIVGVVFAYLFSVATLGPSMLSNYYNGGSLLFGFLGAGCGSLVAAIFCLIAGIAWNGTNDGAATSGRLPAR